MNAKNIRNTLAAAIPILLSGPLLPTSAVADTVLFPVIAVNAPNVTTVVSVTNGLGGSSDRLRYVYKYKNSLNQAGAPNLTGVCNSVDFDRNTRNGDIVSFDASGTLNNGNALFGDPTSYDGGFGIGQSGPIRGYLLVSNCCTGGDAIVKDDGEVDLSGEAIIMDIASGAAWGMKAINDESQEGYGFLKVDAGGGVWSALSALQSNGSDTRRFSFYPPMQWNTRFFITPINSDMASTNADPGAHVALRTNTSPDGEGIYDRQGNQLPSTPITQEINCTGAVNLEQLMDAATWAAVEAGGGWSYFRVVSGNAIVYKLEYVVNSSTYGGTVNNGYLLSTYARP